MSDHIHLDVVEHASPLRADGRRNHVHPADVSGRFVRARYAVFALLIVIWVSLPWIRVGGHPAMHLDVAARHFYLFGAMFNAQDFWLVFFLLSGIGLALITVTTLLGRVWCGWACPQTVFMEGVFRRIERLIEGPRNQRLRLNAAPMSFDKLWRKTLKHVLFAVAALFVSHVFLSFFVSMPSLLEMMQRRPSEHPSAFVWMATVSLLLYGNFAWFREQLCLIVCPYGRLQSVLTDRDSLVVGYDAIRGEPRGKASDPDAGDCVDCRRCVHVCPTGIDIRHGLQLDCIGCTACIDACDDIMDRLKRPRGLIRYDSQRGLEHEPKRWFRPRLLLSVVAIAAWAIGAFFAFRAHTPFEANLMRLRGAPYQLVEGNTVVRNLFTLHLVNKGPAPARFTIESVGTDGLDVTIARPELELSSLGSREIAVYVDVPLDRYAAGTRARLRITRDAEGERDTVDVDAVLLGPRR